MNEDEDENEIGEDFYISQPKFEHLILFPTTMRYVILQKFQEW
jgi:hypothetical protein